ncbi:MAG: hypothetical protein CL947_01345 [Epsilonproteobacteria bacterium]|nr:hypothetical protein [Campylobacterota bacterium]|tara:strand:+ start:20 stop:574 length:555 start_codon:yes stop_codon:yes gene_type:complete
MISEKDVIYITRKQASVAVAALSIFCILIFMVGYFWGKQSVLEGFGQRVVQESEADQASYVSTMQSFAEKVKQDNNKQEELPLQQDVQSVAKKEPSKQIKSLKKHRATLLGFGTKAAALSFVNRLKKQGISVEVKQRSSKSAAGKVKHWYQVVTKQYDSQDQLQDIINKIKKVERIKDSDIKIV